ncbi:MAG TPA: TetR/AcrR family transcriptional regulator [Bacilli bacterium]|nr:TetR/AcrR family transcriptional regulator [Bacilli bacterium]
MAPKVSQAYKEERRANLLQSALHCFAEKGYQATTIDDIVRQAEASKGAVYHYFKSKEDIYLQLMADSTERFFSLLEEAFGKTESAGDKVRQLVTRFPSIPMSAEDRRLVNVHLEFWLFAQRQEELSSLMVARYDRFLTFLTAIIEAGQASGEFRADVDPTVASMLFWGLRDGLGLHFSTVEEKGSRDHILQAYERMFLGYLK